MKPPPLNLRAVDIVVIPAAALLLAACRPTPTPTPAATVTPTPAAQSGQPTAYRCADRSPDIAKPPPFEAPALKAEREAGEVPPLAKPFGLPPVCPEGQVPMPVPGAFVPRLPKGNPLIGPLSEVRDRPFSFEAMGPEAIRAGVRKYEELYGQAQDGKPGQPPPPEPAGTATSASTCAGVQSTWGCYYYASAAYSREADGGGMILTVEKPAVSGGSDHTLDEIAVQGGTGGGDIVELGWNVSTGQYVDANPHLFVFHWKSWAPTCYDGCGWQQWSTSYFPGMDLSPLLGTEVYLGYVVWEGNWWAWFDNQWLGYFPGSEWTGAYTRNNLLQWFGEVASSGANPPVTDMGNGQLPATTTAARMTVLCDVDAADWVCWYRDQHGTHATVPDLYDIARTGFGRVRYGGPGE